MAGNGECLKGSPLRIRGASIASAHSQRKIPKQSYAGLGILSCGLN